MRPSTPPSVQQLQKRHLLLVGGGHSHIQVLRRRMMHPHEARHLAVTLVAREVHTPYSGMLPGRVSGLYGHGEMHIDLARLCRAADVRLVVDEVVAIDLNTKEVSGQSHPAMRCDVLSLNSGAVPGIKGVEIEGSVTPVKPIGRFLDAWGGLRVDLESSLLRGEARSLAVVGAGAGGVELALAIAKVFDQPGLPRLNLTLIEAGDEILPDHNRRVRRWALAQLSAAGVSILNGFQVAKIALDGVVSGSGEKIPAHHTLWTTGVDAPAYPQDSGLEVDACGFVSVNNQLQSLSHAWVFAAGDIADLAEQPRPKSGVYAVRAGPVLAENLLRFSLGRPLKTYRAQKRALAIVGNSRGSAAASRARLFAAGKAVFRLKQIIDRRFMARFDPPPMETDETEEHSGMRCAGCGSKLPADLLARVLNRLDVHPDEAVLQGMGEDAAMIQIGTHAESGESGTHAAQGTHAESGTHAARNPQNGTHTLSVSTDHFPQMVSDTYLFGRIAAHHGLSDLFAMGARPRFALVNLNVRLMAAKLMEEEAYLALKGANDVFRESSVTLVGGHSTESETTALGCTIIGEAQDPPLVKSALEPEDVLVVTKPLGLGVLLAGDMRMRASGRWLEAAFKVMDQSNGPAAHLLCEHGGRSCTDVTGFGLLGHLLEMLRASKVTAEVWLDEVPRLDGVLELMEEGIESSLQSANESVLSDAEVSGVGLADPRLRVLMDPQTSGGLLFGIAASRAEALLAALHQCGYAQAAIIGEVGGTTGTRTSEGWVRVVDSARVCAKDVQAPLLGNVWSA